MVILDRVQDRRQDDELLEKAGHLRAARYGENEDYTREE